MSNAKALRIGLKKERLNLKNHANYSIAILCGYLSIFFSLQMIEYLLFPNEVKNNFYNK